MQVWLIFAVFSILSLMTFLPEQRRKETLAARTLPEWLIDGASLAVQGIVVPALQTSLLWLVLDRVLGLQAGSLDLPYAVSFLLNFVFVDYLYYWNHRILHLNGAWPLHVVHHSSRVLDVFATSRNTLWTSFVLVYFWINGAMLFLLKEPAGYLFGLALTAALDLWRHTGTMLSSSWSGPHALSRFLVTPRDHAWHHSSDVHDRNFGANWNIWDKMHGTYLQSSAHPARLGVDLSALSGTRRFLFPFLGKRGNG